MLMGIGRPTRRPRFQLVRSRVPLFWLSQRSHFPTKGPPGPSSCCHQRASGPLSLGCLSSVGKRAPWISQLSAVAALLGAAQRSLGKEPPLSARLSPRLPAPAVLDRSPHSGPPGRRRSLPTPTDCQYRPRKRWPRTPGPGTATPLGTGRCPLSDLDPRRKMLLSLQLPPAADFGSGCPSAARHLGPPTSEQSELAAHHS
mmetsp:Transcript_123224/g.282509  ORF Transcript_123224/g.282509 Transcript_123224/m.282509 type:complete len:200 (-) Transcript_123224:867-1466(-)